MAAFSKSSPDDPSEPLIRALGSSDAAECCDAARVVGQRRTRTAVPSLIELLYRRGPDDCQIRRESARALGEIGDLRAIQHLGEAEYAETDMDILAVIEQASEKLFNAPTAGPYMAQLEKITMYTVGDYVRSANIYIDSDIQNRSQCPFTMASAKRFFVNFRQERFAFAGTVGTVRIYDGKEALPRHSYAHGWLYVETLDEMSGKGAEWPEPVGDIHFEFGGTASRPYLVVRPEPKWPRPSIVRRCVLDGLMGVRFDELD